MPGQQRAGKTTRSFGKTKPQPQPTAQFRVTYRKIFTRANKNEAAKKCTGLVAAKKKKKQENPIEKCSLCRAFSDFHQAQRSPTQSPIFPIPFAHKISA